MGEWSEYFEDFPEKNPANWHNGQFNPQQAAAERASAERARQVLLDSKAFRRKLEDIAKAARSAAQARSILEKPEDA